MKFGIPKGIDKIFKRAKNKKSYPGWLRDYQLNEAEKKIKRLKSQSDQIKAGIKAANKMIGYKQEQKDSNSESNSLNNDNSSKTDKSLIENMIIMSKKQKDLTDDIVTYIDLGMGITKKVAGVTHKNLNRSDKLKNVIKTKYSVKAGNLAERAINFTGRIAGKDFSEYADAASQLTSAGVKKALLGSTSTRQLTNLRRNRITKKILNKVDPKKASKIYGEAQEKLEKAFNWSLHDSTSLASKGMKKITNPKITGLMKKVGDLKASGLMKKTAGSKIGTAFMKSFSLGNAMNMHSIMTEKSDFKKFLAGADIAGDFASKVPGPVTKAIGLGTSTLNFVGGLTYDFFDSEFMERFGGKKVTESMDKTAGLIVKPVENGIKAAFKFGKNVKDKLINGTKHKINAIKKNPVKELAKTFNPIGYGAFKLGQKAVKAYGPKISNTLKPVKDNIANSMRTKLDAVKKNPAKEIAKLGVSMASPGVSSAYKVASLLKGKLFKGSSSNLLNPKDGLNKSIKGRSRGIKPNGKVIDLYNNSRSNESNNPRRRFSGGILESRLIENNKNSSNKNNFTINISGSDLSVDEIANQLASKIQLTMSNMYA